ncbi:hypothetical protein [Cellulomonas hominis]
MASLVGGHPVELAEVLYLDDALGSLVLDAMAHVAGVRRRGERFASADRRGAMAVAVAPTPWARRPPPGREMRP